MVSVQQEDTVHCFCQNWAYFLLFTWCVEHHVQEVFCVAQVVAWVHERLADAVLVNHCCQSWHFGDQTMRRYHARVLIMDIQ